ncbi:MAG: 6-bladed beta-propeller, partial [Cyclobacteriaceae bacterium]|nr:6-bladed beta-propeller [Cyclobacteriaceae bacterium]
MDNSRRNTIKKISIVALAGGTLPSPAFTYWKQSSQPEGEIIGHGKFKYRVNTAWGNLNPATTPVNNCHEMVTDSKGRLIMITDEIKNNILVYDRSGKLLETWGNQWPGGHGLTIWDEGGEDRLFICDPNEGKVAKTSISGKILMNLPDPKKEGIYEEDMAYRPTETAVGPNGDIYVADGYGSQYILQFDSQGKFIRKFGGGGNEDHQFSTVHGVAIDYRSGSPT